jgi:hypothetical protein
MRVKVLERGIGSWGAKHDEDRLLCTALMMRLRQTGPVNNNRVSGFNTIELEVVGKGGAPSGVASRQWLPIGWIGRIGRIGFL